MSGCQFCDLHLHMCGLQMALATHPQTGQNNMLRSNLKGICLNKDGSVQMGITLKYSPSVSALSCNLMSLNTHRFHSFLQPHQYIETAFTRVTYCNSETSLLPINVQSQSQCGFFHSLESWFTSLLPLSPILLHPSCNLN